MTRLSTGFSGLSNDELYHLGLTVPPNVNGIADFAAQKPLLPPITTAAGALQTAMDLPAGAVREASITSARTTLSGLLTTLANTLMTVPNVTDTDLAGSGFGLRAVPVHSTMPPDAPTGLHLRTTGVSGELQVLLDATPRAVMYDVEYTQDPVNTPWTAGGAYNSTRGIKLTGLTRGKDYYVHVRAVASGQNRGPWSDIASAMVI